MADVKALCWLDLETSGSKVEYDEIIEVGVVVTDLDLEEVASFEGVCVPSEAAMARLTDNEFVFDMHTKNGLIEAISAKHYPLPDVAELDAQLHHLLAGLPYRPHEYLIAGSGVSHFDRVFVRKYMPKTEGWLSYPSLDVGVLRRALKLLGGQHLMPSAEVVEASGGVLKEHRALADARAHLAEARAYKALWKDVGEDLHRLADLCS